MSDNYYLYYFKERFIYRSKSTKLPWYIKMNDKELLYLYEESIESNANEDFVKQLLDELVIRGVYKKDLFELACISANS